MVTDSRRVGYANPWVRPPVEVYSLVPVTYSDGVDGAWRTGVGPATNTVQATFGRWKSDFGNASGFDAGTAEARKIMAVNDSIEWGAFTGASRTAKRGSPFPPTSRSGTRSCSSAP